MKVEGVSFTSPQALAFAPVLSIATWNGSLRDSAKFTT